MKQYVVKRYLTFSTLWTVSTDNKLMMLFLFFPESGVLYFMHIVCRYLHSLVSIFIDWLDILHVQCTSTSQSNIWDVKVATIMHGLVCAFIVHIWHKYTRNKYSNIRNGHSHRIHPFKNISEDTQEMPQSWTQLPPPPPPPPQSTKRRRDEEQMTTY